MSEMIERVAKAIEKARTPGQDKATWLREAARCAIEAMREPTGAMTKAGHDEAPFCEIGVPLARPCLVMTAASYQAMIDTALKS